MIYSTAVVASGKTRYITDQDRSDFRRRRMIIAERKAKVTKLSPTTVKIIRSMASKGNSAASIARGLNIPRTTVRRIIAGETYKWVA